MSAEIFEAFAAESQQLAVVAAETDDAGFARPSPCVPWTAAELLAHVRGGMARLNGMLAAPEPAAPSLVSAPEYYRAGQRFSQAVNDERVASAQRAAAALDGAAARARDFARAREEAVELLRTTPPGRVVRTRHGDRMLLTEFARTRVLELAVHGLDLATALGRPPWMTERAARVTEELLLPFPAAAELRTAAEWDQVTLIAKLTGRTGLTAAEAQLVESSAVQRLALG
jgi:uncharacterized protein (TIGR03083 family)